MTLYSTRYPKMLEQEQSNQFCKMHTNMQKQYANARKYEKVVCRNTQVRDCSTTTL